jgi:hypothetical protein
MPLLFYNTRLPTGWANSPATFEIPVAAGARSIDVLCTREAHRIDCFPSAKSLYGDVAQTNETHSDSWAVLP